MSRSRFITIETKFTTGQPATWSAPMSNPGFLPTGYRVLAVTYADPMNTTGTVTLSHNVLGPLAVFNAGVGTPVTINGRIDNVVGNNLHTGSSSVFTVTQNGAMVTTLNGTLSLLLECSRRAPTER